MTTDSRDGDHLGHDGTTDGSLRPYAAPHLIRLDARATALGTAGDSDGVLTS